MILNRCTQGDDYGRVLRTRRRVGLGLAGLGLLGLVVSLTLLPHSPLSDMARAFYRGASFGILLSACGIVLRSQMMLRRPEKWKAARVRERDERGQYLVSRAAQFAGAALIFLLAGASFVLIAVDTRLAMGAAGCLGLYVLLYGAAYWRLSKKL